MPIDSRPDVRPAAPADAPPASRAIKRRHLLSLAAGVSLAACGGGGADPAPGPGATPPTAAPGPGVPAESPAATPPASAPLPAPRKSAKRGIAYDLRDTADLAALAPGVSWWYNWSPRSTVSAATAATLGMDFIPMVWNGDFDDVQVTAELLARPAVRHLLLLNEPNLTDQANLAPAAAAALWPRYESLAARTGVQLVGPAITWGTMPGFADPVAWLDAFYAAYRAAHGNRDPRIDQLAFHWYDYRLDGQLDRLAKYGKPLWVTEFANWHAQADGAQVDTVAKQKAQMTEMVAVCERRADVVRYAWFTGRWADDRHHTRLLGASGELTELGRHYLSLPFAG